MPRQCLCPSFEDIPSLNGLAYSFKGYAQSLQGFVDADSSFSLWSYPCDSAYNTRKSKHASQKLIYLEIKRDWYLSGFSCANPILESSNSVAYRHNNQICNVLYFDGHVTPQSILTSFRVETGFRLQPEPCFLGHHRHGGGRGKQGH